MIYKKNGETLDVSFDKEEVSDLKALIESTNLPQKRVFDRLKRYIDDNWKNTK